tara:strand:- start:783 stop:1100 length:318 start_codon:yes stop_codon:yes gene_type:complete
MNTFEHMVVGGFTSLVFGVDLLPTVAGSIVPDIMLLGVVNKKEWLPQSHPLIRAHNFLHLRVKSYRVQPLLFLAVGGLGVYYHQPIVIGYASHLLADYFTHKKEV